MAPQDRKTFHFHRLIATIWQLDSRQSGDEAAAYAYARWDEMERLKAYRHKAGVAIRAALLTRVRGLRLGLSARSWHALERSCSPTAVAIEIDPGPGADLDGVDAARFGQTLGISARGASIPKHELIRGRVVDLRRHANIHLYHRRRPPGPSDRYELWPRDDTGQELQFTIHTRTLPARRGHDVTVIESAGGGPPMVVALMNWTTLEAANYAEIDPPPLLRGWDLSMLVPLCIGAIWWFGNAAPGVAVAAGAVWLSVAATARAVWRSVRARQVDVTITRVARVALRAEGQFAPSPKPSAKVVAFRRRRCARAPPTRPGSVRSLDRLLARRAYGLGLRPKMSIFDIA